MVCTSNEKGFTGLAYDRATGLWHADRRDLHPALGTWTQRDPAGYIDGMNPNRPNGGALSLQYRPERAAQSIADRRVLQARE